MTSDGDRRNPDRACTPLTEWDELPPRGLYPRFWKPFFDRLAALVILLGIWPLLVLCAIVVRLDSPGRAFFIQERVGRMGRLFRMFKFRSMVTGAQTMGSGVLVSEGDTRVTRVGGLLRKTSLDELPQLINVLRGEMSFIGPRPTLEYQARQYDAVQRRRLLVKPGVTGWAQVKGRKSLTWPERIECDVEYVDRVSPAMDLRILVLTPFALVRGEGQARSDFWKDPKGGSSAGGAERVAGTSGDARS